MASRNSLLIPSTANPLPTLMSSAFVVIFLSNPAPATSLFILLAVTWSFSISEVWIASAPRFTVPDNTSIPSLMSMFPPTVTCPVPVVMFPFPAVMFPFSSKETVAFSAASEMMSVVPVSTPMSVVASVRSPPSWILPSGFS